MGIPGRPPSRPPRAGVQALTQEQQSALKQTAVELARVVTQPVPEDRAAYIRELTAVARAAVVAGEYREALRGYELLGEALGHLNSGAKHQHLHMHAAPAAFYHASDAELAALLQRKLDLATNEVLGIVEHAS